MGNAAMTESIGVNKLPGMGGKSELCQVDMEITVADENGGDGPRIPGGLVAVNLTQKEWDEQERLLVEYSHCIMRDKARAAEILPRIIWPAWLLKADKKLMGANHIRKKGYNTLDADLAYGPGWLDEDDGGPTSRFSEDYKPLGKYELPREWKYE